MPRSRRHRRLNDPKQQTGDPSAAIRTGDNRVTVKENEKFKNYYRNQGLMSEEEFDVFYASLQTQLPTTFRITGTRSHAVQIQRLIEDVYIPAMRNVTIDGVSVNPPTPLPWYPERLGWQVHAPRLVIKRSPEFSKFHKFIVTETEVGNISRQEAVSMVPPLLMDIQPHQWVLDMCAAPGSKTAQIIEAVHANDRLDEMPAGLVVANDADYKRSHLLVHQSKRLQSPCFVATNHDGQYFPGLHMTSTGAPIRFDRVLCDVPCSGDGTLRKNEKIWAEWSHGQALALHTTQVQIFLRGAQLTKVGGRIVYSTCSFNPVENEAVVAEVLRLAQGALILKDVSDQLPELKRKPGLTTWKVMTRDGRYLDSLDDLEDTPQKKKFPKSVFPPSDTECLNLERCIRIYPHQQDTGGFFVAVFEKIKPMTKAEEKMMAGMKVEDEEENTSVTASVIPSKRPAGGSSSSEEEEEVLPEKTSAHKEAPFDLLPADNAELAGIREFYGLDSSFPTDQFLIRSEGKEKSKTIYFVSSAVRDLLASRQAHRLNVVMTGVRLFVRQNSTPSTDSVSRTPYRLTCEGIPLIDRVLSDTRRRVRLQSLAELRTLLTEAYPKIDQLESPTVEKLETMELGGCVFDIDESVVDASAKDDENIAHIVFPMALPVWRGKVSLSVLLNKQEKR
ncbi:S-adenosyl-L-methionine-dependent methyltransferase [Dichotomocladium elegans]|nr:S-adenosyl-L-methionine-dependent methyltransferase [Dichotomocladium elegans]